ncbi:hypothetical protein VTN00DRAFT_3114 [Thermoascus crustaceus]|uniref:uncharacterized protein n=1 Tax=Thermoascus crustaceus TaxID=5088 RepID=UPI0037446C41
MTTLEDVLNIQKTSSILASPAIKPCSGADGDATATATPSTLTIALQNQTSSHSVYAYVTGLAISNNNALFLLRSDGKTAYYPQSPSSTLSPLSVDCTFPLGAPGKTIIITIPHLAGGRIWFSRDGKLEFFLNPGPELVEPSVLNPSHPNYNVCWDFCEFTFDSKQLYATISYVDFVSIPISLALTNTSGVDQHAAGLPANGIDTICSSLVAQNEKDGAGWDKLIVTANGRNLRALSPDTAIAVNKSLFAGYYQHYVDQVWSKYSSNPLHIDTQTSYGTVIGKVSDNLLKFDGVGSFSRPSTADIFSCSTGSFKQTDNITMNNVTARLAAAFNRSTLLLSTAQPDNDVVSEYYRHPITNHYARICHATTLDGRGYGFPYDDVRPTGGVDQSGAVYDPNPLILTVAVGGSIASSHDESATSHAGDSCGC